MKKDVNIFLNHILESIKLIEKFIKGKSKKEFLDSIQLQDSIIRRLEIISEAVKNLPSDFKNKHKNIAWKKVGGLRDILIHHYFGVDLDLTWDVIKRDLPNLKEKIKNIFKKIK